MDKPLSMSESAVAIHELYQSLIDAGFDTNQALYLVGVMVSGRMERPQ